MVPITVQLPASLQAVNGCVRVPLPRGATVVAASFNAQAIGGSPTNANIVVKDGSTTLFTLTITSAGSPATWKSKAVGGSQDPQRLAANATIVCDLTFTAGSSPSVSHATIVLWALMGVV